MKRLLVAALITFLSLALKAEVVRLKTIADHTIYADTGEMRIGLLKESEDSSRWEFGFYKSYCVLRVEKKANNQNLTTGSIFTIDENTLTSRKKGTQDEIFKVLEPLFGPYTSQYIERYRIYDEQALSRFATIMVNENNRRMIFYGMSHETVVKIVSQNTGRSHEVVCLAGRPLSFKQIIETITTPDENFNTFKIDDTPEEL